MRLTKTHWIMIAISATIVIIVAGGFIWHKQNQDRPRQVAAKQTVGDHTISLNQADAETSSSGLSASGQADSLGQLNGSKSGQSGSTPSGNSGPNTADFAQYDKYRDSPNALIGELQVGSGPALAVGQKANIYYKVWLTNGALIDQSPVAANGQRQPFSFTLGGHQVIPGMEQGVAGMKTGGKRLIIVPPAVGYGAQGQGNIPPNAVLVFEVQLVSAQ